MVGWKYFIHVTLDKKSNVSSVFLVYKYSNMYRLLQKFLLQELQTILYMVGWKYFIHVTLDKKNNVSSVFLVYKYSNMYRLPQKFVLQKLQTIL